MSPDNLPECDPDTRVRRHSHAGRVPNCAHGAGISNMSPITDDPTDIHGTERAVTPVLGTVLLIAVVLVLGVLVAGVAFGLSSPSTSAQVSLGISVDADADRITVVHEGGDSIDVTALSVRVTVDDQPLDRQPPVPFFSAYGFRPGPTGPFNAATEGPWRAGQRASFRLASTNDPTIDPGDRVTVRIYENDVPIAEVTKTA